MGEPRLPYIDYLLAEFAKGNTALVKSFGRHVHWGYWDDPANAVGDDDDYAQAAERLSVRLCTLADIAEGQSVLDVGCGFGGTMRSLNERFGHIDLVGLNIEERQLERARQEVSPLGDNRVAFCAGDACALPFADGSFDRLLAVECVFHFPSREAFFREAYRTLKPNGVMVLSDFVPSPWFMPVSGLRPPRWLEKYNVFGDYDLSFTIGRYRRLAQRTNLPLAVARNVTAQVLPTYRYLQRLSARGEEPGRRRNISQYFIGMQRLVSQWRLLNYCLLSFRKPAQ